MICNPRIVGVLYERLLHKLKCWEGEGRRNAAMYMILIYQTLHRNEQVHYCYSETDYDAVIEGYLNNKLVRVLGIYDFREKCWLPEGDY